jgi:hypothetical protein
MMTINILDQKVKYKYYFFVIESDCESLIYNRRNSLYYIYNFSIPKLLNGVNNTYKNILSDILYDINDYFSF